MIVFYIFAALLVWLSFRSLTGGIAYLRYVRDELAKPLSGDAPFATVIVPCKGIDQGLSENLNALLKQDYPAYEVIFVVDSKDDAAVPVIEQVSTSQFRTGNGGFSTGRVFEARTDRILSPSQLIVADKTTTSSQKVENLRQAVLQPDPRSEVFVFADSDARPENNWLRSLVVPLHNDKTGAATGYRWFIAPEPTFGSELRSSWNASIATALGPNSQSNFCWGGAMAIRRETFERLDIREKWAGTLSDDFTLTRAVKEAGLDVIFVPQALTASVENCTFGEMLEFTTRQMKITRVYAAKLWLMSLFGSSLFTGVMIAAFLVTILSPKNSLAVWAAIATLVLVSAFSIGKSYLRLKAVRLVLTRYDNELRRQSLTQNTLWLADAGDISLQLVSPPCFHAA